MKVPRAEVGSCASVKNLNIEVLQNSSKEWRRTPMLGRIANPVGTNCSMTVWTTSREWKETDQSCATKIVLLTRDRACQFHIYSATQENVVTYASHLAEMSVPEYRYEPIFPLSRSEEFKAAMTKVTPKPRQLKRKLPDVQVRRQPPLDCALAVFHHVSPMYIRIFSISSNSTFVYFYT